MRRFGEPIDPDQNYRDRPGAYGIIVRGGDLLVTEQEGPPRELQLPGGGIDAGESPTRALHRECMEETGWSIRVLRHLGIYQRFCYMPEYDLWAHKICHIYLCRPGFRHGPPAESGHRALWMTLDAAAEELSTDGDRHFVEGLLRKR